MQGLIIRYSVIYWIVSRTSAEALFNPVSMEQKGKPEYGKSTYFKDLGVGVLRYQDKTVVLKYGPYGGGHGHPDKLSISIHNVKFYPIWERRLMAYLILQLGIGNL